MLHEKDVMRTYITPAIARAGWDLRNQVRQEVYLTKGRIIVHGKLMYKGESKYADYVLYYKPNVPLAIVEAKDDQHPIGGGMQQALEYAELTDIPFVFTSNGKGFLFHDKTMTTGQLEVELRLDELPSPDELWRRYESFKNLESSHLPIVAQPYYTDASGKSPRYYQLTAINRTVEAIAKGQNRILLVMATGTGKTYTAFQIIWRLWESGAKRRILFLADRNILVDQARQNDFKPFDGAMTKITNREVDKSYEIYLSLYQAVTGNEEEKDIYKQFSPDFFDLVIVDECHRGSAAEDSAWREILEYFSSATQIGMTATPKETKDVSNIDYFGDPVYTYSLRQGIEDGFLAPYKVVRIDFDRDLEGYQPEPGQLDRYDVEIEERLYNQRDFDRELVLDERTKLVARKVTEFLKETNRFDKTIIFCEDIEHAERMRQALVNENSDMVLQDRRYIMRITGDSREGKAELDNFIDPAQPYPVIVTTSKLMTTGIDAQTCKLIVLDRRIGSMTEFKQIIGRGSRLREDYGKYYFTIMDFKMATALFADPEFDGDPVQIYRPGDNDSPVPPEEEFDLDHLPPGAEIIDGFVDSDKGEKRQKYYVDNVPVTIVAERVEYYDADGNLVTESFRTYARKTLRKKYQSLNAFLQRWSTEKRKAAIIEEFDQQGVLLEALRKEVGQEYSDFDLICHVAFDQPPLTRKQRAEKVRKDNYFARYGEQARRVLEALLDKYADDGLNELENARVLRLRPISDWGTPLEIVDEYFGGKDAYNQAVRELQDALYAS
ncbi:MAG: DEAD/DEAH box helicase family protein [Anaerolineae bacterium]|nr:DEAD/DEAH box helicase family protein [Anaerolineae bacterium]